jgi:hypothetical protein
MIVAYSLKEQSLEFSERSLNGDKIVFENEKVGKDKNHSMLALSRTQATQSF